MTGQTPDSATALATGSVDNVAQDYCLPQLTQHIKTVGLVIPYASWMPREELVEKAKAVYGPRGIKVVVVGEEEEDLAEKADALLLFTASSRRGIVGNSVDYECRLVWIDLKKQFLVTAGSVTKTNYGYGVSSSIFSSAPYGFSEEVATRLVAPLFVNDTEDWVSSRQAVMQDSGFMIGFNAVCSDDGRYVFFVDTDYPSDEEELQGIGTRNELHIFDMVLQETVGCVACVAPEGESRLRLSGSAAYRVGESGVDVFDISQPGAIPPPREVLAGKEVEDIAFSAEHTWVAATDGLYVFDTDPAAQEPVYSSGDLQVSRMVSSDVGSLWLFPRESNGEADQPARVQTARIDQGQVTVGKTWVLPESEGLYRFALGRDYAVALPTPYGSPTLRFYDLREEEPRLAGTVEDCPADEVLLLGETLAVRDETVVRLYRVGLGEGSVTAEHLADVPLGWPFPAAIASIEDLSLVDVGMLAELQAWDARLRYAQNEILGTTCGTRIVEHEGKRSLEGVVQVIRIELHRQ